MKARTRSDGKRGCLVILGNVGAITEEADVSELDRVARHAKRRRIGKVVHKDTIAVDHVGRVHQTDPMGAVFPIAVASLVARVNVRIVGDDLVPEQEQGLVEARSTVAS